jgi:hypothetical protein
MQRKKSRIWDSKIYHQTRKKLKKSTPAQQFLCRSASSSLVLTTSNVLKKSRRANAN